MSLMNTTSKLMTLAKNDKFRTIDKSRIDGAGLYTYRLKTVLDNGQCLVWNCETEKYSIFDGEKSVFIQY